MAASVTVFSRKVVEATAAASLAFPPVPATAGNEAVFLVYSAMRANNCSFSSSLYVRPVPADEDDWLLVGGWDNLRVAVMVVVGLVRSFSCRFVGFVVCVCLLFCVVSNKDNYVLNKIENKLTTKMYDRM